MLKKGHLKDDLKKQKRLWRMQEKANQTMLEVE